MVKHTQIIRRQFADELFDVFNHFVEVPFKFNLATLATFIFKLVKTDYEQNTISNDNDHYRIPHN